MWQQRCKDVLFCWCVLFVVQVVARNEGDLVAKFYFAKRMLVWEILRNGLKEKVEIEWSNIIGIQAFMEENKRGILEVEVITPKNVVDLRNIFFAHIENVKTKIVLQNQYILYSLSFSFEFPHLCKEYFIPLSN